MKNLNEGMMANRAMKAVEGYTIVSMNYETVNGFLFMRAYSKESEMSEYMHRYHLIVIDGGCSSLFYHDSNVIDDTRFFSHDEVVAKYKAHLSKNLRDL